MKKPGEPFHVFRAQRGGAESPRPVCSLGICSRGGFCTRKEEEQEEVPGFVAGLGVGGWLGLRKGQPGLPTQRGLSLVLIR